MKKSSPILFLFILLPALLFAQANKEGKNILYHNEVVFGGNINSNGWGVPLIRRGKHITVNSRRIIEIEFAGIKHPKETKQQKDIGYSSTLPSPKAFIFGKQHSFYVLRGGFGRMHVLFEKAKKNGVQVRYIYLIGASLGLLKPYYLNLLYEQDINVYYIEAEKYDSEIPDGQDKFLDLVNASNSPEFQGIYGRAGFGYGLGELKIIPGGYGKIGLNFEWAKFGDQSLAIEVGSIIDAYPQKVPIMILEDNKPVFLTFYISFLFGRQW